jgi:hypothetical protein
LANQNGPTHDSGRAFHLVITASAGELIHSHLLAVEEDAHTPAVELAVVAQAPVPDLQLLVDTICC